MILIGLSSAIRLFQKSHIKHLRSNKYELWSKCHMKPKYRKMIKIYILLTDGFGWPILRYYIGLQWPSVPISNRNWREMPVRQTRICFIPQISMRQSWKFVKSWTNWIFLFFNFNILCSGFISYSNKYVRVYVFRSILDFENILNSTSHFYYHLQWNSLR